MIIFFFLTENRVIRGKEVSKIIKCPELGASFGTPQNKLVSSLFILINFLSSMSEYSGLGLAKHSVAQWSNHVLVVWCYYLTITVIVIVIITFCDVLFERFGKCRFFFFCHTYANYRDSSINNVAIDLLMRLEFWKPSWIRYDVYIGFTFPHFWFYPLNWYQSN